MKNNPNFKKVSVSNIEYYYDEQTNKMFVEKKRENGDTLIIVSDMYVSKNKEITFDNYVIFKDRLVFPTLEYCRPHEVIAINRDLLYISNIKGDRDL